MDVTIARAKAEAAHADSEVARLARAAAQATSESLRLRSALSAAGVAIAAAEARISASDAQVRKVAASLAERREKLAQEQRPIAALLAGIASMARRPPLLTLVDEGSVDEYVRVRALLDTTIPAIRHRTASLRSELARERALQREATAARARLQQDHAELGRRRAIFVTLEQDAVKRSSSLTGRSIELGDVALTRSEDADFMTRQRTGIQSARRLAAEIAMLTPAPPRPFPVRDAAPPPALAYHLPLEALVTEGLGEVSQSGVRARGLTLAARRGARLSAPANGRIVFAGPFRMRDGLLIIDHGDGWMSLLSNASTPLPVGSKVRIGEPLGRALGAVAVELYHRGRPVSAALISGSSEVLSKGADTG